MLTGQHYIDCQPFSDSDEYFQAVDPRKGAALAQQFVEGGAAAAVRAAACAARDFEAFRSLIPERRAALLDEIASQLRKRSADIVTCAGQETGLPDTRLLTELTRTTNQLSMFADYLRSGQWQEVQITAAQPEREPASRPDLRRRMIALGPVAVFGASNFPLAFSVAGGDTASALAAGCPVVVKGHPAHPGTSELAAQAICAAIAQTGIPSGAFSLLQGTARQLGAALVQQPQIKAVAFTGSLAAGRALYDLAAARDEPIPVYAEMGSINPVFVLPDALRCRWQQLAGQYAESVTLGVGQFCTNPGVLFAVTDESFEALVTEAARLFQETAAGVMLHEQLAQNYRTGIQRLKTFSEIETLGTAQDSSQGCSVRPELFLTSATNWLANPSLADEVFGPATLVVGCRDVAEMLRVASCLPGQLSATLQLEPTELQLGKQFVALLETRAGRIVINQFPTGVEVCPAMVHGGPYPATTDSRATSVGTAAINRFLRPICYQGFPADLLPEELAQHSER